MASVPDPRQAGSVSYVKREVMIGKKEAMIGGPLAILRRVTLRGPGVTVTNHAVPDVASGEKIAL